MNINCPKCGFNQPEDQYCANCGVDMANYEPPKKPIWQRVISNWIFQLGVLLVIVIFLVSRDIIFPPKNTISASARNLPPVEQRSYRGSYEDYQPEPKRVQPVKPPPTKANAKKVLPPGSKPVPPKKKRKLKPLRKKVGAFFYLASREQLEEVVSEGDAIEDGVFVVPSKVFARALKSNRAEWKKLKARGPNFEFGTPQMLFFGKENKGFFFRATVVDQPDPMNLNVEVREWYEFKKDEPVDGFTIAHTLSRKHVMIFAGFAPKEEVLAADDKKSTDPVLKAMNDPQFKEDIADLVLVMQFK